MIDRRLQDDLVDILGPGGVWSHPADRRTYECDGLTTQRVMPGLVVLPRTTEEVVAVVRACAAAGVPIVPRGAGSGLSAGALPQAEGVLIGLARMRDICAVDPANRQMTVQAGVTTAEVNRAAAPFGLYYAPDPSSGIVCTLGGNVAENSGGAHCLKYGFTSNHVLALEVVLPDGEVVRLGSAAPDLPGYDLRGAFVGSEGTMGIVTEVTVRLLRRPEAVRTLVADFESPSAAGAAVSGLVAAGIVPAAVEMIDNLAIQACEDAVGAGFSRSAGAVLIVELDGVPGDVEAEFAAAGAICVDAGSTHIRVAADAEERALIWAGRKAAFAAIGRLSPNYVVQDGVIPRGRLPEVLDSIGRRSREAGMQVANVFHAGDGNLHPLVLYDGSREGEQERALRLSIDIIELCVEYGGSISGEHGIGLEKACSMSRMFSQDDLEVMQRVRRAFDPAGRCNPGKIFPTPGLCGERSYRAGPLESADGDAQP